MPPLSRYLVVALVALVGCAGTNPAPPEWSPTAEEAGKWIHGHWVVVTLTNGKSVSGELLAVGEAGKPGQELVFVGSEDRVYAVRAIDIRGVQIVEYEPRTAGTGTAWVTVGTLSTISHGLAAVLTIPGWLLLGGIPVRIDSRMGVSDAYVLDGRVSKFARFPQGMPAALLRNLKVESL